MDFTEFKFFFYKKLHFKQIWQFRELFSVTGFTSLNNKLQYFEGKMKHVCICNSNTVYLLFERHKEKKPTHPSFTDFDARFRAFSSASHCLSTQSSSLLP